MMAVYRLTIEYDGSGWHGWQSQAGVPTIQEAVEHALATALRTPVTVVGSGRTDAGVHAAGQVAHFTFEGALDTDRLTGQLNGILPRSIAVRRLAKAPNDFHARYDAVLRTYRYGISTVPIALERRSRLFVRPSPDFDRMNRAANQILGKHDFSAFCRTSSETMNRICDVRKAAWVEAHHQNGEASPAPGGWDFIISADRFLHGMVRAVVGTLLEVGQGKRAETDVEEILASRDRRVAGPAAPARGLVLQRVSYPEDEPSHE